MDPIKATIFELIPQNDGYFLLKNTHGSCFWHHKGDYWFSWGGGYAMAYLCYANSDNSWKNDLGQVNNKDGRALWWNGEYRI